MNITPYTPNLYKTHPGINNNDRVLLKNDKLCNKNQSSQNRVHFTGLKEFFIKLFVDVSDKPAKLDKKNIEFLNYSAEILGIEHKSLFDSAKNKTQSQFKFLNSMVEKYNSTNFKRKTEDKENPNIVLELFEMVKHPTDGHFRIVDNTELTITEIKQCFDKLKNDSSMIKQAETTYQKLTHFPDKTKRLMEIINSPKSELYLRSLGAYLSDQTAAPI